ncbi:MAG: orotate phosphoribosyltransferase [Methanosarcinales archaeon]
MEKYWKNRNRLKELIKEKSLIISDDMEFKLASGGKSNFFFDMKNVSLDPEGANLIADAIIEIIKLENEEVDYIGGLESGAIPIVAAVCEKSWLMGPRPIPGFFLRKEPKKRGTMKLIEGNLKKNSKVIILDDVTTKGGSVLNAVNEVRKLGCIVNKVITVVDRLEGAKENLTKNQITLFSLFTKDDFGI